ncbi:hypothetical protein HYPSUDRAFT_786980 [Hypholoma sublateritium FD-334 SS-4]|uniref:EXPERA domain-containing protein n=1 Tax=Hypholoma sublateritium (strain FD-334 SS-4) TaxID=945553 RepID=A0A0D2MAZ5_HYPSF|nr:hypothetical protein HYPSUDRAFT_786980 [Hypholoma sublateritium FD-334 SS-4]
MAPKRYTWITVWFLITAPIILWDAGYVLMRPRSMEGGDLRWFWSGFDMYERIDNVYSVKAYHAKAGFAPAAAISNLIETSLNLIYLFMVHVSRQNIAPLFGFSGAGMTLTKTTIWILQEHFCGKCSQSSMNELSEIIKFWVAPNIVWYSFCTMIVIRLGKDISNSLNDPVKEHRE